MVAQWRGSEQLTYTTQSCSIFSMLSLCWRDSSILEDEDDHLPSMKVWFSIGAPRHATANSSPLLPHDMHTDYHIDSSHLRKPRLRSRRKSAQRQANAATSEATTTCIHTHERVAMHSGMEGGTSGEWQSPAVTTDRDLYALTSAVRVK